MKKITNIFKSPSGRWYWTVHDTAKKSSVTYHTDPDGAGMLVNGLTGEIHTKPDGSKYTTMEERIIEGFNSFSLNNCKDKDDARKEIRKYLNRAR